MLHWTQGAAGRGALFSGDIVMVIGDRNYVSFMRSYPNMVPLSAPAVERIGATLEPFAFDAIYGAFFDRNIALRGVAGRGRSIERNRRNRGDGLLISSELAQPSPSPPKRLGNPWRFNVPSWPYSRGRADARAETAA